MQGAWFLVSVDVWEEVMVDSSEDSSRLLPLAGALLAATAAAAAAALVEGMSRDSKLGMNLELSTLYHFNVESSGLNSAMLICTVPWNMQN